MRDLIDQTADRLIEHYCAALEQKEANWEVSREGLRAFKQDLEAIHPTHPALMRVQSFIDLQDKKCAH